MIKPQSVKILIAEDENDLREILASRLKAFGFQTLEATGGEQAFEIFKAHPEISTIITDIRMPGGTGIDLLRKLKAVNPLSPKVFIASSNTDHSKRELYGYGAEGVLEKPYDTRALIEMVRKSLLSNKERWQMPPNFSLNFTLEENFESYDAAAKAGSLEIGRGGVFLKTSTALPKEESYIHLKISATPLRIDAVAKIKWIESEKGLNRCVGLEFFHIGGSGADALYEWIERTVPASYIPASSH